MNEQIDYFHYAPKDFLRSAVQYVRHSVHAGKRNSMWVQLNNPLARRLVILSLPIALIVFVWGRVTARS